MRGDYVNKLDWVAVTLALTFWAAHFMLLWTASSVFPDQAIARWLAGGLTVAALAGLWFAWQWRSVASARSVPGLAILLAGVAIAYSLLPAIIS